MKKMNKNGKPKMRKAVSLRITSQTEKNIENFINLLEKAVGTELCPSRIMSNNADDGFRCFVTVTVVRRDYGVTL